MLTDEEIGKKIVETVWRNEKHSSVFFISLQKQLSKLNVKTTKEATKLYDKILLSLDLKDKLVENSVDNLSKVSKLMLGIDKIQKVYRKEYGKTIKIARQENQELIKDREDKITKLLSKVGIVEKSRTVITKENKTLLKMLNQQGYKRINQTLEKWKNFAYDMFYIGVTRGMTIENFKSLFYTDVGTLKIGSALAQEVEMDTMISITGQRTAFLQQRAKELGYKYCWNSNPMDMRTKPECIGACLSGVITEVEMGSVHGFPPRFLCRCELCYTRGEWVGINKGVNRAIANRRLQLLDELKSAPNQMSAWMRLGKEVHVDAGKYPLRAAGMKPYKEIEDKIKLIEGKKVPEFEITKVDEIVAAIKAYTAKGGVDASRYPFTVEKNKILIDFLKKAPKSKDFVYRGMFFSEKEWNKIYETWTIEGSTLPTFRRLTSFTKDPDRAFAYGRGEVAIRLKLKSRTGVDITKMSLYKEEKEVLFAPGLRVEVIKVDHRGGRWYIEVKEK